MISKIHAILKYSVPDRINRAIFSLRCSKVFKTAPIEADGKDIAIVCMVSHKDLIMFLIAAKTFYRKLNMGFFVVLNDGSLTKNDIQIIKRHIVKARIVNINEIENLRCPAGCCWERILLIADLLTDNYVVELDSDVIVINDIKEVIDSIEAGSNFMMVDDAYVSIQPITAAKETAENFADNDVQTIAEKNFDKLKTFQALKYIRGSGGFCGYHRSAFTRYDVEQFSSQMETIIGEKWHSWGSEKVTSSFLFANTDNKKILPFPKYAVYFAKSTVDYSLSSAIHFIGKFRYKNDFYAKLTKKFIQDLI